MTPVVLIVGGTGVFGSRLAGRLISRGGFDVVVAGRDAGSGADFCTPQGGRFAMVDRTDPALSVRIAALRPALVVDASGPFQRYGAEPYRLARAALACGAHYLDLSDDADFTTGIARLDAEAKARGLCVISGASSVPGLSSAAADALVEGLADIHLIESVILPGNRAPRGISIVRAILAQVGRPSDVSGAPVGWSDIRRETFAVASSPPLRRLSSPIGAPDLVLFPTRYRARAVRFRAGLELWFLHVSLWALARLVRAGFVASLEPFAPRLKAFADRLEGFGSDRGGMRVRVLGKVRHGPCLRRDWTLLAESGSGPSIPGVPASVLCGRILAGKVPPGARPCLGAFDLAEAEAAMTDLEVRTERVEVSFEPLFAEVLGADFDALPAALRDLHTVLDARRWDGTATVTRGTSIVARLVAACIGFPKTSMAVPVTVTMQRSRVGEHWERNFAGRRFRSVLRVAGAPGSGLIYEQFGPLRFEIGLVRDGACLLYPVRRAWAFGVPLPRWMVPTSETAETAESGIARFDVSLSVPLAGLLVHYRGWLADSWA